MSRDLEKGMIALGQLVKKSHGRDEIDFTDFFLKNGLNLDRWIEGGQPFIHLL